MGAVTPDTLLELSFVNRDGDIMTGYLSLVGDPLNDLHAATKRYVDLLESILRNQACLRDGSQALNANWNMGAVTITVGRVNAENMALNHIWPLFGTDITVHGNLSVAGSILANVGTFALNDATPDVSGADIWLTNNANPTTITAFNGLSAGKRFSIIVTDANTTIQHGAGLVMMGGGLPPSVNFGINDHLEFESSDGVIAIERNRSINST